MEFMFHANPTRRTYQILAVFPETPLGKKLAKGHQKKLQGFVNAKLKDTVFSQVACYSDLSRQSTKSINQLIREGLCVKYYPFR